MNNYSENDTDNESYDLWDETDDEEEFSDLIYESDEPSLHP